MTSMATTPEDYLRELPPERADELSLVRDLVNAHVPDGVVEVMDFGMIAWVVPLEIVPRTYNKKPLMYAHADRCGARLLHARALRRGVHAESQRHLLPRQLEIHAR